MAGLNFKKLILKPLELVLDKMLKNLNKIYCPNI